MPDYLLLLHAPEADEATQAQRWSDLPRWDEVTDEMRDAGQHVANGALDTASAGAVVRVRNEATEVTDGPFEMTKEILAGFYVLTCRDLDEAVGQASRLPIARYGSVEVRPIMDRAAADQAARPRR